LASGRGLQLTKQVGEYLVCAELCRKGLISTSFTGNVPEFDILAIGENNIAKRIQVKTIRNGNWQFDAERFIKIKKFVKNSKMMQKVIGPVELPLEELYYVFVNLKSSGKDEFYILTLKELQEIIENHYTEELKKIGDHRPRKPDSTHAALQPRDLIKYKDKWNKITD